MLAPRCGRLSAISRKAGSSSQQLRKCVSSLPCARSCVPTTAMLCAMPEQNACGCFMKKCAHLSFVGASGSERPPVTTNAAAGSPSAHSPYPRTNSASASSPYPRARSRTPTAVANRQNSRSAATSSHPAVPVPPMPSEYSRPQSPSGRDEAHRDESLGDIRRDHDDLAREQTFRQRVSSAGAVKQRRSITMADYVVKKLGKVEDRGV